MMTAVAGPTLRISRNASIPLRSGRRRSSRTILGWTSSNKRSPSVTVVAEKVSYFFPNNNCNVAMTAGSSSMTNNRLLGRVSSGIRKGKVVKLSHNVGGQGSLPLRNQKTLPPVFGGKDFVEKFLFTRFRLNFIRIN